MSSSEFKTIYEHAAAIAKAQLSSKSGVDKLLADLEKRVPDSQLDPKIHRELFFEPRIIAQRIGVPTETAEATAVLLHQIGVLRLWVRVTCPDTEEHEVGTILETDDPDDFQSLASHSCDYCGAYHDLEWENCETVYAISTRLDLNKQNFDYSRLKSPFLRMDNVNLVFISDQQRCEVLTQQTQNEVSSHALLLMALDSNRPLQNIPAPYDVWSNAWAGPTVILLSYFFFIIPLARFAGERLAWGATVLILVVVFLVIRGQVQAKLAPSAVQRTAMYMGFPISAGCFTAGATGLHIRAGAGDGQPWWTRFEFGEPFIPLIAAGSILFISILLFVWGYDYSRGWLRNVEHGGK